MVALLLLALQLVTHTMGTDGATKQTSFYLNVCQCTAVLRYAGKNLLNTMKLGVFHSLSAILLNKAKEPYPA